MDQSDCIDDFDFARTSIVCSARARSRSPIRRHARWIHSGHRTNPICSLPNSLRMENGRRLTSGPTGTGDIWIEEGTRLSRFTFDPADDRYQIWSPDGTRVVVLHPAAGGKRWPRSLYKAGQRLGRRASSAAGRPIQRHPIPGRPTGNLSSITAFRTRGDLMVLPLTVSGYLAIAVEI